MSALLQVEDLSVTFRERTAAVRGISLEIAKGETHCLVGESGCGKSVTALAVMNLLARGGVREARRIALGGEDMRRLSDREMARIRGNRMAMIFQEPMTSLNPGPMQARSRYQCRRRRGRGCVPQGPSRYSDGCFDSHPRERRIFEQKGPLQEHVALHPQRCDFGQLLIDVCGGHCARGYVASS
jgi:ABC-type oligopeptide transport system ATPase subunit